MKYLNAIFVSGAAFLIGYAEAAQAQAFSVGGDPRVDSNDFVITEFATGLNFPGGIEVLPDGSLLVGTTNGPFFNSGSMGQLVRIADTDGDGVSDTFDNVGPSLPGGVTAIRRVGDLLFVTSFSGDSTISVLQIDPVSGGPVPAVSSLGSLDFDFAPGRIHATSALAVRETSQDSFELFFGVGSEGNEAFEGPSGNPATIGLSSSQFQLDGGSFDASLDEASVYKITVDTSQSSPTFLGLEQVASGLRNASALEFAANGDLYIAENGIDGLTDPTEPLSADELNIIAAGDIGGTVENFGFGPNPADLISSPGLGSYIEYRTGNQVGTGGIQPEVAFLPIPDPSNGAENEGAAAIAFAPANFPAGLNEGLFVPFFGEFGQAGLDNAENPLAFVDLNSSDPLQGREFFHFISSEEPNIGHITALLATEDSLFVADLDSTGSFLDASGLGQGNIYQIQAVEIPFELEASVSALFSMGLFGWLKLKNKDQ